METIIQFDQQLLLMLNGSDSLFVDQLAVILTNARTWIPLYIALFYMVKQIIQQLSIRQWTYLLFHRSMRDFR